ncbi:Odorant receptor 43a [Carabus blaptoides fortunei]
MDDLEEFTESTFLLMTILAGATKALTIQIKQKRIKNIVHQLNSDLFQPKLSEHHTVLVKAIDEIRFLFRLVSSNYGFNITLLCIFPFFDNSKKLALPIKAWFPYSLESSPVFELTYLHQVTASFLFASLNCAFDTFFVSLIVHSIAQLDILLSNLSMGHLEYWKDSDAETKVEDKMLYLKQCAIHHEVIVKYVEEIESLFNFSILVQFFMSGLILCINMFQITVAEPLSVQFLAIIVYEACMLGQLYLYCWYGNELFLRSMMISEAAYFSDWYAQGTVYCQSLQIIMVRATMPIQIRAGYFFSLSLETFTSVC